MALENKNITVHIGMPKSASTTLQKYFSSKLKGVHYAGPENKSEISDAFLDIIKKEDSYFDISEIDSTFKKLITPDKPLIMSSEFACSFLSPLSSGIPQSKTTICNRLHELVPQAKIMIVIRSQFDLHKSLYAQQLRNESDSLSFKKMSFDNWINKNIDLNSQHWQSVFELADYHTLIKLYQSKFDRVKVFVFEEIIDDMEGFVNKDLREYLELAQNNIISPFVNNKENLRHNKFDIMAENNINKAAQAFKTKLGDPFKSIPQRRKTKLVANILRFFNSFSSGKIETEYSDEQSQFLIDYYKESNEKTSKLIRKDLSKYGYPS